MTKTKSQASLEYLIILGIGLVILTAFILYAFYYVSGYNTAKINSGLNLAIESLSNTVEYLSSQQTGSTLAFSFSSPGLNTATSYFCQNSIVLSYGGQQTAKSLAVSVIGELPTGTGQFSGKGKMVVVNGRPSVAIEFNLPVAYVNSSFELSDNVLSYNISFQSLSGSLVTGVNFTMLVYSLSGTLISNENYTTTTGIYNGETSINSIYSGFRVVIYSSQYSIMSTYCIAPLESIPITLYNTQNFATAQPFQQEVAVNSSQYLQYEANNISNIQFSYSNGTVIPSWLESGNIATFNGASSYVNIPTVTTRIKNVTIGLWAFIQNTSLHGTFVKLGSNIDGGYGVGVGNVDFDTAGNQLIGLFEGVRWIYSGKNIGIGWHYITFIINDTGAACFYLDGNFITCSAGRGANPPDSTSAIGADYNDVSRYFPGKIANVQIYNTALSSQQVSTLYTKGMAGAPVPNAGLTAWYPLSGNALDYSGNNNNGIATNVVYNGVGSGSTNTIYWLKIGSIPAASSLTIYMSFYPKSYSMFNSLNTGEAPQLSPTYAEYDDGANVFTNYWNFAGTTAPTGFTYLSGTGASYNNGVTLAATTDIYYSSATYNPSNYILEGYVPTLPTAAWGGLLYTTIATAGGAYGLDTGYAAGETAAEPNVQQIYSANGGSETGVNGADISYPAIFSIYWEATDMATEYTNYGRSLLASTTNAPAITNSYIGLGSWGASSITFNWLRIRAYPPNGVMPISSISPTQTYPITTFIESDLPNSYKWYVTYDNVQNSSSSNLISFSDAPGLYTYSVNTLSNTTADCTTTYTPSPSSGSLIAGSSQTVSFSSSTPCITTFTASNLPQGSLWCVKYNGIKESNSTGFTIQFSDIPGTYSFSVPYAVGSGSCTPVNYFYGYAPSPSSGTLPTGNTQTISYTSEGCTNPSAVAYC
ncbi:MAG: hypothetical protein M1433_00045 [Candidatus Parvarchaeota archaeon]|nr:hypothetical protein [Candidatus Parvarchaeota archaeon]